MKGLVVMGLVVLVLFLVAYVIDKVIPLRSASKRGVATH